MSNSTLHFAVSQSSAPSSSPMSNVKHYPFGMQFAERVSGLQIISVCAKSAEETSQSMRMREGGREKGPIPIIPIHARPQAWMIASPGHSSGPVGCQLRLDLRVFVSTTMPSPDI